MRAIGTVLAEFFVALLPRRHWARFANVGEPRTLAAAVVTLLVAGAIGVPGFINHATAVARANNRVLVDAATRQDPLLTPSDEQITTATFVAAGGLSLFTFVLLTPAGWISTYLGLSGTARGIGVVAGAPFGDPILTVIDAGVHALRTRSATRHESQALERQQGPALPDRIRTGSDTGWPEAAIVVVASRRKPGWTSGAVVMTDRGPFRILREEDRVVAGRLRHLYGLVPHADLEAFRRVVHYDFPPSSPPPGDPSA